MSEFTITGHQTQCPHCQGKLDPARTHCHVAKQPSSTCNWLSCPHCRSRVTLQGRHDHFQAIKQVCKAGQP